ncbi:hypothetical protein ACJJWD_18010 [Comamonas testosteroni]|uniref:hypothetical protein n=1 Tax=Comamonas testosteroni TaxID=285 RepID=UPI00389AE190
MKVVSHQWNGVAHVATLNAVTGSMTEVLLPLEHLSLRNDWSAIALIEPMAQGE